VDDTAASDTTTPDTKSPADTVANPHSAVFNSFGIIETLAGTGLISKKGKNGWKGSFEGGPAIAAELSRPHITLADAAGILYIADKDAHAIRRVALDGTISTLAGTGEAGDDGDAAGPAAKRRLSAPNGLWVLPDGTCYVYDLGNDKVRKVDPTGSMTTLFSVGGSGTGRGLWVAADESQAYISAGSSLSMGMRAVSTPAMANPMTIHRCG